MAEDFGNPWDWGQPQPSPQIPTRATSPAPVLNRGGTGATSQGITVSKSGVTVPNLTDWYRKYLGRDPGSSDISIHLGGGLPANILEQGIANSPEAAAYAMRLMSGGGEEGGHEEGGGGGVEADSSLFVPAGPQQQAAMAALESFMGKASPTFDAGNKYLQQAIAGKYLDPTKSPVWGNLRGTTVDLARDLFADMSNQADSSAAAQGIFDSSARLAQRNRAAERVSTATEQDLATRAFGQYANERNLQQQAAGLGAELGPTLAAELFGAGEKLRSGEQSARTAMAEIEARLQMAAMQEAIAEAQLSEDARQFDLTDQFRRLGFGLDSERLGFLRDQYDDQELQRRLNTILTGVNIGSGLIGGSGSIGSGVSSYAANWGKP